MHRYLALHALVRLFPSSVPPLPVLFNKIKELEQLLDFHTQMGNEGTASILKAKIEKLKKSA